MKKETTLDKLNAILGLTKQAEEVKVKASGKTLGISEHEIQTWREIQGIIYYLHAPHLFQPKICKNCGTRFVVSRLYVAFCSYLCIKESLRKMGIEWSRDREDYEILVTSNVYEGNEPIWIRESNLLKLKGMLDELFKLETPSLATQRFQQDPTGVLSDTLPISQSSLSSAPSQTTLPKEPIKRSSTKKPTKRASISIA